MPVDLAALENASKSLETSLHHLELWLALWTLAVVIGLLVEYGFDLPNNIRHKEWHIIAGAILITLGVAGELYVEARASIVETNLRGLSDSITGELNRQTADAERQVEVARKDAATANERAANANERASKNELTVQQLKADNLKLEERLAPRRVSSEQAKKLCSGIHVTGRPKLNILSIFGTNEADDFAEDIGRALAGCEFGFDVTDSKSVMIFPVPTPLRIGFAPNRKHDADMINAAMLNAKIATKPIELLPTPDAAQYPEALRLFVGPKPSQ